MVAWNTKGDNPLSNKHFMCARHDSFYAAEAGVHCTKRRGRTISALKGKALFGNDVADFMAAAALAAASPSRRRRREGGGRNATDLDRPTTAAQHTHGRAKSQYFLAFGKAALRVGVTGRELAALTPTPTAKGLARPRMQSKI